MQWQGKWRGGSHLRMCLCSCCAIKGLILILYVYQKRCATRPGKGLDSALQNENENIYHYYLLSKAVGIDPVRQPEEGGCPSGKQGQAGKGEGRQKQEGISRGWRWGARRASTVVRQEWPQRKEDQLAAGGQCPATRRATGLRGPAGSLSGSGPAARPAPRPRSCWARSASGRCS